MKVRMGAEEAVAREETVLAKAVVRAAERLRIAQKDLAEILGVSASSVSRLCAAGRGISPGDAEGQRALHFLRIYRSLDGLLGGEQDKMCAWLRSENKHLGGVPAQLVKNMVGMVHVAEYLDAMRGTY